MNQFNNRGELYQSLKVKDENIISNLDKILESVLKLFNYFIYDSNHSKIFSNKEYIDTYTICYNICTKRESSEIGNNKIIYEIYTYSLSEYFNLVKSKLDSLNETKIVYDICKEWKNFQIVSRWLSLFFSYLDRYYLNVNMLDDIKTNNIKKFYEKLIVNNIEQYFSDISELINLYRSDESEKICDQINNFMSLLTFLPDYEDNYIKLVSVIKKDTCLYYEVLSNLKFDNDNLKTYLILCDKMINLEKKNKFNLTSQTIEELLDLTLNELLYKKYDHIINHTISGVKNALKKGDYEHLSIIYKFYIKSESNSQLIKNIFVSHLENETEALLEAESDLKKNYSNLILKIYSHYDKYLTIISNYLSDSHEYQSLLCSNIRNIFDKQKENNSMCYYLVLFISNTLISSKIDDKSKTLHLDTSIIIFKNVSDKDLFLEYYKIYLSNRLLSNNFDIDLEKSFLSKIKFICGGAYTSKLETMIKDYTLFNVYKDEFNLKLNNIGVSSDKFKWFNTRILTQGIWPIIRKTNIILPHDMRQVTEYFYKFYNEKYNKHKLIWCHHRDEIVLDRIDDKSKYSLHCNIYQAIILLLFNNTLSSKLTHNYISEHTGIDSDIINKILHSLCCTKYKLLSKTGKNNSISEDDLFSINTIFKEKNRMIKLLCPNLDSTKKKDNLTIDRNHILDAVIVRIMKSRKMIEHNELVSIVITQIHMFKADSKSIKKRIESLIERDFLERDSNKSYKYVA